MDRSGRKIYVLAVLVVLGSGCGGAIPKTHYYVLDLPASAPQPQNPAPYAVVIMPFRAPEQIEQDRIVYRPSPVEVDFYEYHRWAERPSAILTTALAERLRARNLFAGVTVFDGRARGDYIVRGRLERLEEVDSPGSVAVRVEMAAEVIEAKTNRVVWTGSASHNGPVTESEVKAVVSEMSRGVENCLGQIAAGLASFAKSLPPAPAPASSVSR